MMEMYENLAAIYGHYFAKSGGSFSILRLKVVIKILESVYRFYVRTEQIMPINSIDQVEQRRYWNLSGEYFEDKDLRITASKAAYLLEIMTKDIDKVEVF